MKDITHIAVSRGDGAKPEDPPQVVYVEAPAPDMLEAEPFVSGRHRLQRLPDAAEKPPTTLWSWSHPAS